MTMINVQLEENGPITQMDKSKLKEVKSIDATGDNSAHITEYWLNDRCVHRSVNVHLKKI
jgi:hypothetical protein